MKNDIIRKTELFSHHWLKVGAVSLALVCSTSLATAQTCTTSLSCEELGYKKGMADCIGAEIILKCPSDQTKTFCPSVHSEIDSCTPLTIKIKGIVANNMSLDVASIKSSSRFIEDLGFNGLALVDLVMEIEREFGLEIPDADVAELKTVDDVVKYIADKKYMQTCSGMGYAGGVGNGCGSPMKYETCSCAVGYTWNAVAQACVHRLCVTGNILYPDGSCSSYSSLSFGKTAKGIVLEIVAGEKPIKYLISPSNVSATWSSAMSNCSTYDYGALASEAEISLIYTKLARIKAAIQTINPGISDSFQINHWTSKEQGANAMSFVFFAGQFSSISKTSYINYSCIAYQ